MHVVFSRRQMEICFSITCYWLSPGHNLTVARRYRAIFSNFFRFCWFFLFEFLNNTYLDLFWWFVGGKMHLSKKKYGLFPYISSYKGISKEMVPEHEISNFSFSFHHFFQIFYSECQYSWLSSRFIENIWQFNPKKYFLGSKHHFFKLCPGDSLTPKF